MRSEERRAEERAGPEGETGADENEQKRGKAEAEKEKKTTEFREDLEEGVILWRVV